MLSLTSYSCSCQGFGVILQYSVKGLPQHLFESLCIDHLQRHGASKKAITRAFDDDVEFQERMAEHIRYMVETIAHHQVDIDSEV
ncbi:hypothetical protein KTU0001_38530 [Escherichia coli]|nr:hypothetical protein KTU0001_38530 [Escherichia coli]